MVYVVDSLNHMVISKCCGHYAFAKHGGRSGRGNEAFFQCPLPVRAVVLQLREGRGHSHKSLGTESEVNTQNYFRA